LLTKREWAANILEHSREDLHYAIEQMKLERKRGNKDFEWPDIPKILGLLDNRISPDGHNSNAYLEFSDTRNTSYQPKQIESDAKKSATQSAHDKAMAEMWK